MALSCSGLSATTSWAVEQFGLAMMFFLVKPATASAFTSGTISGTSGYMRQADEWSITTSHCAPIFDDHFFTTVPCAPIFGDHSFYTVPLADIRQISTSEKS